MHLRFKNIKIYFYTISASHKYKTSKTCSVAPFALAQLRTVPGTE